MDIFHQIEAVYRRALLLRQYATESPVSPELLEKALQELYFVLEELQTSQEELNQQNLELAATRQAVEIERQCYQLLFELAPSGQLLTDLHGNIQQANRYAADRLFFMPQDYLINKPVLVFIDETDRDRFQSHLMNVVPGQSWEVMLNPRKGTLISVAIAITPIKDPKHRKTMLLWSLQAIPPVADHPLNP